MLRPPSFDQLESHLSNHLSNQQGHYHILHFDGHGAYVRFPEYKGFKGCLLFEHDNDGEETILAEVLGELLARFPIPLVILDACQSGMTDESADHPFASVAAALVACGIPNVIAMSYTINIMATREFFPAFYQSLFETGSISKAVCSGSLRMREHPERICARGKYALEDWLVPVLYQQRNFDLFFEKSTRQAENGKNQLPESLQSDLDDLMPHGFFGRDDMLLKLERAIRMDTPVVLISGLGGIHKDLKIRLSGFLSRISAVLNIFLTK